MQEIKLIGTASLFIVLLLCGQILEYHHTASHPSMLIEYLIRADLERALPG